jgi:hypothetical protein
MKYEIAKNNGPLPQSPTNNYHRSSTKYENNKPKKLNIKLAEGNGILEIESE